MSRKIRFEVEVETSFNGTDEEIQMGFHNQLFTFVPNGYSPSYLQTGRITVVGCQNESRKEVCEGCGGTGTVLVFDFDSDEPIRPCPMCKGEK